MQKRIGLYGDSWACGEFTRDDWIKKTYVNSKKNYLINKLSSAGFDVTGYGQVGGSNFESYKKIIAPNTGIKNFDIGIVIITEPFRDYENRSLKYDKHKSFNQNCAFAIQTFINFLRKFKDKIILVNGLYELDKQEDFFAHLSYCKTLVPEENWPQYYAQSGHIKVALVEKKVVEIDKESIIKDVYDDQLKENTFYSNFEKYPELFFPDGCHPNKKAQEIFSKSLVEVINGS